jgi:bacterioferritin-associated ferredoxin
MIVCSCNVLSDRDVRAVLTERSLQTPCQVYGCLACIPRCGCCARTIRRIIEDMRGGAESA